MMIFFENFQRFYPYKYGSFVIFKCPIIKTAGYYQKIALFQYQKVTPFEIIAAIIDCSKSE